MVGHFHNPTSNNLRLRLNFYQRLHQELTYKRGEILLDLEGTKRGRNDVGTIQPLQFPSGLLLSAQEHFSFKIPCRLAVHCYVLLLFVWMPMVIIEFMIFPSPSVFGYVE